MTNLHNYIISCFVMSSYITLHYLSLCLIMLYYVMSLYITWHQITAHYITSHFVMACYVTPHCDVTLHCVQLHYSKTCLVWTLVLTNTCHPQTELRKWAEFRLCVPFCLAKAHMWMADPKTVEHNVLIHCTGYQCDTRLIIKLQH